MLQHSHLSRDSLGISHFSHVLIEIADRVTAVGTKGPMAAYVQVQAGVLGEELGQDILVGCQIPCWGK